MNPITRIEEIISRIKYKPNVTIRCYRELVFDDVVIEVCALVIDAEDFSKQITIISKGFFRTEAIQAMGEKELILAISRQLKVLELHEIDEFFKVDGKHIKDPHPEFRELGRTAVFIEHPQGPLKVRLSDNPPAMWNSLFLKISKKIRAALGL